jgi:predicted dehydrogenase
MQRRKFLQASAALSAPLILPATVLGRGGASAPSERIRIALIGCGRRGTRVLSNMLSMPEIQCVTVCDPDQRRVESTRASVDKSQAALGKAKGCDGTKDFREVCSREDIDAVIVATPDHWHALIILEALRQGKDVYGEKPITHLFAEGQAVYREVAKQKAIFQVGSQQRSDTRFRIAAEIVLNGLIGKVRHIEVGLPTGRTTDIQGKVAQPIPDALDYDLWCGPSRRLPYHEKRLHWDWRWCLDYGGGQLMDWIGHHNDIAHWGLGLDHSGPIQVEARNFRYPDQGMWDNPIDYEIRSTYADGYTSSIANHHRGGCKWIGEDGWVWVNRGEIEASNREWIREVTDRGPVKAYESKDHRRNFIEGVLTRKECICPAETGHRSITPGHLGYVSDALGRALQWDPVSETVRDDPEADELLKSVPYRGDWSLG